MHGYARATLDVDFFIDPERGNAERVRAALAEFGYDVSDLTVDDLLTQKVLLRQFRLQTDFHPSVSGADVRRGLGPAGRVGDRGDARGFASLDDLIAMKESGGTAAGPRGPARAPGAQGAERRAERQSSTSVCPASVSAAIACFAWILLTRM